MVSSLPAVAEETSREVRRYGGDSGFTPSSTAKACHRLLRQRGVVFTVVPDKIASRKGSCEYKNVVTVTAIGSVKLRRPATVRCALAARLEWWLRERIQPAAVQTFGQPIREIDSYRGYSCRNAFGLYGGRRIRRLSQHGRANALDIGGFVLENGEKIDYQVHWKKSVRRQTGASGARVIRAGTPKGPLRGWRAKYDRRKDPLFKNKDYFLRKISFGACSIFNKVFTPDWDYHHRHHIHIDLASAKLCGYASPKNARMTAASEVPAATGGAAVALAAFRNTTVKIKDSSVAFVTRNITRRIARSVRQTMLVSSTERRYEGPDRGAIAKAAADAGSQAQKDRQVATRTTADKATTSQASQTRTQGPSGGRIQARPQIRPDTRKPVQVAARPDPRREETRPDAARKAATETKPGGLSRVLGILLGRSPAERSRPETKVAARTASGGPSGDKTTDAGAAGGALDGPVVGLGKSGGRVIVTPRLRRVGRSAPKFVQLIKPASTLLD